MVTPDAMISGLTKELPGYIRPALHTIGTGEGVTDRRDVSHADQKDAVMADTTVNFTRRLKNWRILRR